MAEFYHICIDLVVALYSCTLDFVMVSIFVIEFIEKSCEFLIAYYSQLIDIHAYFYCIEAEISLSCWVGEFITLYIGEDSNFWVSNVPKIHMLPLYWLINIIVTPKKSLHTNNMMMCIWNTLETTSVNCYPYTHI